MIKKFQSSFQFSCNVYIISSGSSNILIDPGHYDRKIKKYLEDIGGLDAVLLTHGHWDHTYGLDALKKDYPDVPVYIYADDRILLQDPYLNGSAYNGFALIIRSDISDVTEGKLRIGEFNIDVIHTPGHSEGSVLYYFQQENVIFTGDTVLKDISSPTFAQTASAEEFQRSVRKIIQYGFSEDTKVYPGHGDSTNYEYLLKNNPDIKGARL